MQLLKWRFGGGRETWPRPPASPVYAPPPATVAPGTVALTFIGHSTFLLALPGFTILTDPVFSERCSPVAWAGPRRARPPGLALEQLPHIDLVLVSHNHYDHLDLPSLRRLVGRGTQSVVTTLGNERLLKSAGFDHVGALDWWESRSAGPLRITATPARHFSRRGVSDMNRTLWADAVEKPLRRRLAADSILVDRGGMANDGRADGGARSAVLRLQPRASRASRPSPSSDRPFR